MPPLTWEAVAATGLLWTSLGIEGRPPQPRTMPLRHVWEMRGGVQDFAARMRAQGRPLVLDIEHRPGHGDEFWWLDSRRDAPEVFARGEAYMLDRLREAKSVGAVVSLWSRPSQNGMTHVWKNNAVAEKLRVEYERRWKEAERVLALQDFVSIQLYLPVGHKPFAGKELVIREWIARGEYFVEHARRHGKPAVLYVSPTWGGFPNEGWVPADALRRCVDHFLARGVGVVIWGGNGKTWDDEPICQLLSEYLKASAPQSEAPRLGLSAHAGSGGGPSSPAGRFAPLGPVR